MVQYFPFIPSNSVAPNFQPTLDGVLYNVVITWNVSAQRYYINIYDVSGNLIASTPLQETSKGVGLASLFFDTNQQLMIATFLENRWMRPVGQIVQYTLQDCIPNSLNVEYECMTLSPLTFSFPMVSDPGSIIQLGSVQRYMNMLGPWFQNSTMIYRNQQFEVRP